MAIPLALLIVALSGQAVAAPASFERDWIRLGVTAVVLKSRLKDYKQPSPVLDAQQAVRLVHENAKNWGIDEKRVGIMGFSAGAHLAAFR